jgi:uncharacterized protein YbbK (DUF523 family)
VSHRPRVGISACLLGEAVRYDGRDKREPHLLEALRGSIELVPFCPEVEAGFGVPREPMHLVTADSNGSSAAIAVLTESGANVTKRLERASARLARAAIDMRLSGFVLKSRSPSCGITDVPIVADGSATEFGSGVFVMALKHALPQLPMEDELRLADPGTLDSFLNRVRRYDRTVKAERS